MIGDFRAQFPEFDEASDALVQQKLGQAQRSFDAELFGEKYQDAVMYKTADLLASSPFSRTMRLDKGQGPTVYAAALEGIVRSVPASALAVD